MKNEKKKTKKTTNITVTKAAELPPMNHHQRNKTLLCFYTEDILMEIWFSVEIVAAVIIVVVVCVCVCYLFFYISLLFYFWYGFISNKRHIHQQIRKCPCTQHTIYSTEKKTKKKTQHQMIYIYIFRSNGCVY